MPAAGGRTDQGYLSRLPSDLLPKEVVKDIFTKAQDESMLLRLGRRIPVSVNETVLWTAGTFPEAGQVGGTTLASREGAEKPIQGLQFGTPKSFSPIKLAVIVTVSDEFASYDPDSMYSELAGNLSGAIARAADLAVFHNRDAITGAALVGTTNNSSIAATSNAVALDFDGDPTLVTQFLTGAEMIEAEGKNYNLTAWAADPSMRFKLATARTTAGQPIFQGTNPDAGASINLNAPQASLFGVPLVYGRSVRGRLGSYTGSNIRMVAGDFSQLAWGFADQIRVKVSDQATVGGVSMWQTNQVAVLAEATFGWIVNDADAFVKFTAVY